MIILLFLCPIILQEVSIQIFVIACKRATNTVFKISPFVFIVRK